LLVVGTLHINSAAKTIDRLIDVYRGVVNAQDALSRAADKSKFQTLVGEA